MNDFTYYLSVSEFLCVWNNLQEKGFRNLSVTCWFHSLYVFLISKSGYFISKLISFNKINNLVDADLKINFYIL